MDYVILDFETTGLNTGLKLDEPVQIGLLDSSGNILMHQYIMPTVSIDDEAYKTHGIDGDMLAHINAPTFLQVFQTLARLIEGKTVIVYNAAYDVRILLNAAHNAGIVFPKFQYECLMQRYAEAWKQPNGSGFKPQKLVAAIEQQGFIPLEAHDAIADCYMAWMLKKHLDAGVDVKVFDPNAPMIVTLVSYEKKMTKANKPYASFKCHDGQTLNVFDSQFVLFDAKGWDIHQSLRLMEEGKSYPLKTPIVCRIAPDGNYINLVAVETECPPYVPPSNTTPASQ
jgi:DNA polymerase-3 subunit epsilon